MKKRPTTAVKDLTVFVAEDDFEMRSLMVTALQARCYSTQEAGDGGRLLELLEAARAARRPPALIVCDIRMPVTGGLAVLKTVREWGWDVPFVMITAFGSEQTLTQAVHCGASAVLSKPFELEDLCTTVHYLVR